MWPCSMPQPAPKRSACRPDAAQATLPSRPMASRIYATHIYPNPPRVRTEATHRAGVGNHRDRRGARRRCGSHSAPLASPASSISLSPPMAVSAWSPNIIPRTSFRSRISNTAAHSLTRSPSSVRMWASPVEVPLDELERYASQPFGVVIAPDKSRIYVTCGGSESGPRHRRSAPAAFHPRTRARIRLLRLRSLRQRQLRSRPHPRRPRSARPRAQPRWPQAICRQSPRRHHQRHRHAHQSRRLHHRARRPQDHHRPPPRRADLLHRALFFQGPDRLRHLPHRFHLRRPSPGISSPTASAATSSQTACSKTSRNRALQMERRKSQHSHRMRPANRKIFLALGELRRSHPDRSRHLHSQPSLRGPIAGGCPATNSRPAQERGKAIFERDVDKFGKPIPNRQSMLLLSQRRQRHQPEVL